MDVGGSVLAVDSDFTSYGSSEDRGYRRGRVPKDIRRQDIAAAFTAAKAIAAKAHASGRGIALEKLNFGPSRPGKKRRMWLHMTHMIARYANKQGVPIRYVNPAYTSQTCPSCNHCCKENRPRRNRFKCLRCGFADHADIVGARNIRRVAEGRFHPEHADKPSKDCSPLRSLT